MFSPEKVEASPELENGAIPIIRKKIFSILSLEAIICRQLVVFAQCLIFQYVANPKAFLFEKASFTSLRSPLLSSSLLHLSLAAAYLL